MKESPEDTQRNALVREYLRLVGELNPRHVAFENVPGMIGARWHGYFQELIDGLDALGFTTASRVLDAADYGVPQHRKRILVVASRLVDPRLPKPSHASVAEGSIRRHRTVRDAIAHLAALESGDRDPKDEFHVARRHKPIALKRLKALTEGEARTDLPKRLRLKCHQDHNGHYDIYGRMWWDRPAPTLTSGCTNVTRGRFGHPEQHRAITLREAMLLQGFPRSAVVKGSGEAMSLQVGNAVPPPLAKRIGACILGMDESAALLERGSSRQRSSA
jgi:DNA (cytosine-5)-methyltransferase 1